jgi:hypothetical protein
LDHIFIKDDINGFTRILRRGRVTVRVQGHAPVANLRLWVNGCPFRPLFHNLATLGGGGGGGVPPSAQVLAPAAQNGSTG